MILFFYFYFFLKSSRPSFSIKRAALGNLKASFHCTHWHRFFPLKKAFFYLSVSPARKDFFRKPTRPSLPLRKAPPLFSVFSPQGRKGNRPTRCSEPLRSKVGGPSKVFAMLCGMGPPGAEVTIIAHRKAQSAIITLSATTRTLMIAWSLLGSYLYFIFIINLCCTLL